MDLMALNGNSGWNVSACEVNSQHRTLDALEFDAVSAEEIIAYVDRMKDEQDNSPNCMHCLDIGIMQILAFGTGIG